MNPYEYLRGESEDIPAWLNDFNEQSSFPREEFFKSQVVYYPGSGFDGHPVKLFGRSHSAHCFVYVDCGVTQNNLEQSLEDPKYGFSGYYTLARLQLSERDLVSSAKAQFGFLEVLERNSELDDSHGASRIAILFLGADGISSYDALFCQEDSGAPPFAVLLQDHGCITRFGRGGRLCDVASRCNVFPEFLVVAENTKPWKGYSQVKDIEPDMGGRSHNRYLYKKV